MGEVVVHFPPNNKDDIHDVKEMEFFWGVFFLDGVYSMIHMPTMTVIVHYLY